MKVCYNNTYLHHFFMCYFTSCVMRLIFSVFIFICTSLISCSNSYQQSQNLEIPINTIERAENIYYRLGYTVSFNPELNIPNWVAWELNSSKLIERESRAGHFIRIQIYQEV